MTRSNECTPTFRMPLPYISKFLICGFGYTYFGLFFIFPRLCVCVCVCVCVYVVVVVVVVVVVNYSCYYSYGFYFDSDVEVLGSFNNLANAKHWIKDSKTICKGTLEGDRSCGFTRPPFAVLWQVKGFPNDYFLTLGLHAHTANGGTNYFCYNSMVMF